MKKPAASAFLIQKNQNSQNKEMKQPIIAATEVKQTQLGTFHAELAPKHLNFNGITSSSSSDDEDEDVNCEDVGEDSMPAVHSHHAAWAEYYYQKVY